jgi:hypothetical protein
MSDDPNLGNVQPYLDLITSEHRNRPNYIQAMTNVLQPFADLLYVYEQLNSVSFDLDTAIGVQLDAVGVRVGVSRQLSEPLPNVYFSFGVVGLGFGQGVWFGPYSPVLGIVSLPDDGYRTLIRATIAANHWNGTVENAYSYWNVLLGFVNSGLLIQEFSPGEVLLALTGTPDAVTQALFLYGHIDPRPATIEVRSRLAPSVVNTPYFGFWPAGVTMPETTYIGGFGQGAWGITLLPVMEPTESLQDALVMETPQSSEYIQVIEE